MHEFVELLLSGVEVFGFAVPLLWLIAASLLVIAIVRRAWSPVGVVALLTGFSYLVPFMRS